MRRNKDGRRGEWSDEEGEMNKREWGENKEMSFKTKKLRGEGGEEKEVDEVMEANKSLPAQCSSVFFCLAGLQSSVRS